MRKCSFVVSTFKCCMFWWKSETNCTCFGGKKRQPHSFRKILIRMNIFNEHFSTIYCCRNEMRCDMVKSVLELVRIHMEYAMCCYVLCHIRLASIQNPFLKGLLCLIFNATKWISCKIALDYELYDGATLDTIQSLCAFHTVRLVGLQGRQQHSFAHFLYLTLSLAVRASLIHIQSHAKDSVCSFSY